MRLTLGAPTACGVIVLAILTACVPQPGAGGPRQSSRPGKAAESGVPLAEKEPVPLNVGDIEAAVKIEGVLAERSHAPNITEDQLVNLKRDLDMTTITVAAPYPAQLWIAFRVKCATAFTQPVGALRARIYRDGTPVGTFAALLDGRLAQEPLIQEIDVLAGLADVPATCLLHVQAEVFFLPEGANPQTADLNAVSVPPERVGSVLSNPVRINFGAAEGLR